MSARRLTLLLVAVLLGLGAWFWSRGRGGAGGPAARVPASAAAPLAATAGATGSGAAAVSGRVVAPLPPVTPELLAANYPVVAPLNAPNSNIAGDLETLRLVFEAWRTNFPRDGNPVGENADITAALAGDNRLSWAAIPRNHPAIDTRGELCDRWGTPFRFHQIGGEHMEVRSAGPDRKFGTADDAVGSPGSP